MQSANYEEMLSPELQIRIEQEFAIREEQLTTEQKEHTMQEARQKRKRMQRIGGAIVITVAIINVLISLIAPLIVGWRGIFVIGACTVLSIAIVCGHGWARGIFIAIFSSVLYIMLIMALEAHTLGTVAVFLPLLAALYSFVAGLLLFVSKSVNEYMYSAANR